MISYTGCMQKASILRQSFLPGWKQENKGKDINLASSSSLVCYHGLDPRYKYLWWKGRVGRRKAAREGEILATPSAERCTDQWGRQEPLHLDLGKERWGQEKLNTVTLSLLGTTPLKAAHSSPSWHSLVCTPWSLPPHLYKGTEEWHLSHGEVTRENEW